MTEEELAAFVARTCASSGVPERVEDPIVALEVATSLTNSDEAQVRRSTARDVA